MTAYDFRRKSQIVISKSASPAEDQALSSTTIHETTRKCPCQIVSHSVQQLPSVHKQ